LSFSHVAGRSLGGGFYVGRSLGGGFCVASRLLGGFLVGAINATSLVSSIFS
jgi:hypothetical protein